MENHIQLRSLSFGGFRSFGEVQRFPVFSKINLLVGQNNSGKSNILRFIHDILPQIKALASLKLNQLDRHFPGNFPLVYGFCLQSENVKEFVNSFSGLKDSHVRAFIEVFSKKNELTGTSDTWFEYDEGRRFIDGEWNAAFKVMNDNMMYEIFRSISQATGGDRSNHWQPALIKKIQFQNFPNKVVMIPAIRQVAHDEDPANPFSGAGIIQSLAKLQNPDALNRDDKKRFDVINDFLKHVTDNETAEIEIPHDRNTILVHMNGRTLPLESLGTGIHEVVILASGSTALEDTLICLEEPELHLNPILQKKLIRYLEANTSNQYFISTHSSAFMDTPGAEIYHVRLDNNQSEISRVTSDKEKSAICEDLGYHPSDLIQSNCVIWVEGPSDRVYLKHWITSLDESLIEGIHYSIMFYGGRLLSHLSGEDVDELVDDFISLRRLNRRSVIVIDSDKKTAQNKINRTKQRLKEEFDKGPGYAWITKGREIENYIEANLIKDAVKSVSPSLNLTSSFKTFDSMLANTNKKGLEVKVSKVDVANYVASKPVNLSLLDLKIQINKLVGFIKESNPKVTR